MDFSKRYKFNDSGTFVHLDDPETGEPLYEGSEPVGIVVAGVGSTAYRKAESVQHERRLRMFKGKDSLSSADLETLATELLAAVTLGAKGVAYDDKALTDPGVAAAFYRDPAMRSFRQQVEQAVGNQRNFLIPTP
jgi:hypothetical protein